MLLPVSPRSLSTLMSASGTFLLGFAIWRTKRRGRNICTRWVSSLQFSLAHLCLTNYVALNRFITFLKKYRDELFFFFLVLTVKATLSEKRSITDHTSVSGVTQLTAQQRGSSNRQLKQMVKVLVSQRSLF